MKKIVLLLAALVAVSLLVAGAGPASADSVAPAPSGQCFWSPLADGCVQETEGGTDIEACTDPAGCPKPDCFPLAVMIPFATAFMLFIGRRLGLF